MVNVLTAQRSTLEHAPDTRSTPLSRRGFLVVGGLALVQSSIGRLLGEDFDQAGNRPKQAAPRNPLKSMVIVVQGGAQSPYEFVSPNLEGTTEYRGEIGVIRGSNDMPMGADWPGVASVMRHCAVIRSVNAENNAHNAQKFFPAGSMPKTGETLAHGGIPYVFQQVVPSNFNDLAQLDPKPAFRIGFDTATGRCIKPPMAKTDGLADRAELLNAFDTTPATTRTMQMMDKNRALGLSLLLGGGSIDRPFDRSETAGELTRFGDNPVGRQFSLASQFAQSGAGVTLVYNEPGAGWDMHSDIRNRTRELAPNTDRAMTSLIQDAIRHDFVVLITTEHGRTPKINGSAGRDHYHVAYMIGAGGKFKPGAVMGCIDKVGDIKSGEVKASQILPTAMVAAGVHVPAPNNVVKEILA